VSKQNKGLPLEIPEIIFKDLWEKFTNTSVITFQGSASAFLPKSKWHLSQGMRHLAQKLRGELWELRAECPWERLNRIWGSKGIFDSEVISM
jgi:hypothetical protein